MEAKVAEIRAALPVVQEKVFLNTGTAGPLPRTVLTAMKEALQQQAQGGRIDGAYYEALFALKDQLRAAMAHLLGCSPAEVALTANTTEGMNLAVLALNWRPGDEVITTNLEHPGGALPCYVVRDRFGATVKVADVLDRPEQAAAVIERLITPRTRMIVLSHVAYSTGAVLPIRSICEVAHRHGVLVAVDGAQSFAAIPVDVRELGCDFYAVPGQKWLCGPEGTGALYMAERVWSQTQPMVAGYFTVQAFSLTGGMLPHPDARRFEAATAQPACLAGQLAAARWLTEEVGTEWAFARIHQLAAKAHKALSAIDGVTVLTPKKAHAGLITFTIDGVAPEDGVKALAEQGILIRPIPEPEALRLSTGFYNTEEELDRFAEAVRSLVTR